MRNWALALIAVAAITASVETADARINCGPGMNSDRGRCVPARPAINCGPGMNSDGGRCVPIGQRYDRRYYRDRYDDRYDDYRPRPRVDCGPGMNSDGGYRCVPARPRYRYY
jgi:hypothetical protein